MSGYLEARAQWREALMASAAARVRLRAAATETTDAYRAHPLPALAIAAGTGFVLGRLHLGKGVARTAMRFASGPGWRLVRQYLRF